MGDIPEIRTKMWVSRNRKVQIQPYEPVDLIAGVQQGFESILTAKEISDWMKNMETVVMESLNRQEETERIHKNQMGAITEKTKTDETGTAGNPMDPKANINKTDETGSPTSKQIDFMRKHDIYYTVSTSKAEATKLISEEIDSWKNK